MDTWYVAADAAPNAAATRSGPELIRTSKEMLCGRTGKPTETA
jgi:hypothetical protein